MKLPLITRDRDGRIFHVLQFEGGRAYGVYEDTLAVTVMSTNGELTALSEPEYAEWKSNQVKESLAVAKERAKERGLQDMENTL